MSSGQKLCFGLHGPTAEDTVRIYPHPHPGLLGHRHLGELSHPLPLARALRLCVCEDSCVSGRDSLLHGRQKPRTPEVGHQESGWTSYRLSTKRTPIQQLEGTSAAQGPHEAARLSSMTMAYDGL